MLFKHATQIFYFKKKAGVDGPTPYHEIMRSSTSQFKLEKKLVTQVIKMLSVNSFIATMIL